MTKKTRKEFFLAAGTFVVGGALLTALIMVPHAAPAEAIVPPVTVISETTTTYTEVIKDVGADDGGMVGGIEGGPIMNVEEETPTGW